MKRYSEPYLIKWSNYLTEWSEWSPDPVPYIDSKWGKRILLPNPVEVKDRTFYWYEQKLLDDIVQSNSVIYLKYGYFDWQLDELRLSLSRVSDPRILVSFCELPGKWPDNVRIINTEPMAYQFSKALHRSKYRPLYHRRVADLSHQFTIMAMGQDQGRHKFMMMLNQLGLLNRAEHSNPDLTPEDGIYTQDDLAVNSHLTAMSSRVLGSGYVKFNVEENLSVIPHIIDRGHFYISIDTNPFLDNRISNVTEKIMWGVSTATPLLPIWATNKAQQMHRWGFSFDNVGYKTHDETEQSAVQRWSERVLLWNTIAQQPDWAQSWEDARAGQSAHNAQLARTLWQRIDEDIAQQIDELPLEYQRL